MRWPILIVLAVLLLAACGGGASEADDIASRTPRGTEEAQEAFERFLGQPLITEAQAEQGRDMVWRACAALQDGGAWQEFEDQELAAAEQQGRPLTPIEISGVRTAAGLGISAYCPQHEDKAP